MTTKYFCKDTNAQTTCDVGSANNFDLDKAQGTPTTVDSANTQSAGFQTRLTFDIDVSGDAPHEGQITISLDVVSVTANVTYRFHAVTIDDADCTLAGTSGYSAEFTDTGIKTLVANLGFPASEDRLRIAIETRKNDGHGNQSIDVNVNDPDSFIIASWPAAEDFAATSPSFVPPPNLPIEVVSY